MSLARSSLFLAFFAIAGCSSSGGDATAPTNDSGATFDGAQESALDADETADAAPPPCRASIGAPTDIPFTFTKDDVDINVVATDADAIYVERILLGGTFVLERMERSDPTQRTELTRATGDGIGVLLDGDALYLYIGDHIDGTARLTRIPTHGGAETTVASGVMAGGCSMVRLRDRLYLSGACVTGVQSVPKDGGAMQSIFAGFVDALVTDGVDLYGTAPDPTSAGRKIVRLHDDGSNDLVARVTEDAPNLVGVDEQSIYYWLWGHDAGPSVPEGPASIRKIDKTTGATTTLVTERYRGVEAASLDCSGVFYHGLQNGLDTADALHRVSKDGGAPETIVARDMESFSLDASSLTWTQRNASTGALSLHTATRN